MEDPNVQGTQALEQEQHKEGGKEAESNAFARPT